MKKAFTILSALILIPASAYSADVTVATDFNSAYVDRGITWNENPVFQPWVDIQAPKNIGINIWFNYDLQDYDRYDIKSSKISEVDLTIYKSFSVDNLGVEVGYIDYLLPHQSSSDGGALDDVQDLYVSLSYPLTDRLSVNNKTLYEFDETKGWYSRTSLSLDNLTAGVGHADNNATLSGEGGWHEWFVQLDHTFTMEYFNLGVTLAYTDSIDKDVLPEQDVNFYGGVSFSREL